MSDTIENGNGYAIKGLDADRVWTFDKTTVIDLKAISQRVNDLAVIRTFTHALGSEVSAKVGGEIDDLIAEGKATAADRDSKGAMFESLKQKYRREYADAILADTWGLGKRGPSGARLDPVETLYNRQLEKEAREYFNTEVKAPYDSKAKVWSVKRRNTEGELVVVTMDIEAVSAHFLRRRPEAQDRIMTFARNAVELNRQNAEAKKAAAANTPILEDDELVAA